VIDLIVDRRELRDRLASMLAIADRSRRRWRCEKTMRFATLDDWLGWQETLHPQGH
jgi:hypothetical protein